MITIIILSVVVAALGSSFLFYYYSHRRTTTASPVVYEPLAESTFIGKRRYPINEIYDYIRRDLEKKGIDDAISKKDVGYKEKRIKEIVTEGIGLCEKVVLTYNEDIGKLEVDIDTSIRERYLVSEMQLKAQKEVYEDHIKEIGEIKTKLNNHDVPIIEKYKVGFAEGEQKNLVAQIDKYNDN